MQVIEEDGYVKVYRGDTLICAAVVRDMQEVVDLTFMNPQDRKCNRTRQAACKALQKAGYR